MDRWPLLLEQSYGEQLNATHLKHWTPKEFLKGYVISSSL